MSKDDVFDYVMESPQDTNPTVLRSLLNGIQEGGGTELPVVDSGDNGKVLGVVEGAWNKMDAPSPEVVTYDGVYSDGKIYFSSGDTQKAVVDAYKAGKDVRFYIRESGAFGEGDALLVPNAYPGTNDLVIGGTFNINGSIVSYTCTFDGTSTAIIGSGVTAAKAVASSGGSDPFVVTVTWNDPDFSANKTYAQIVAAVEAGKPVYCSYGGSTTALTYYSSYECIFAASGTYQSIVSVNNSDEVTVTDFADMIREIVG